MKTSKVWLVTGASKGFGLAVVKYLLGKGETVVATTRDRNKFEETLLQNPGLEAINLDLLDESAVGFAVKNIIERYGQLDVLINNAGHGFAGAIEEASETEVAQVLAINVEASLRMIRQVLPYMRGAKNGHIISMSSMAGLSSVAGWGIYNTSKYAVEGFSEALYYEVKELGIKVTIVEPGGFRTNFLDNSLTFSAREITDYASTVGAFKCRLIERNGKQFGDPDKAAAAIYDVVEMENPPLRLLLGSDALERAERKIELLQADFQRMRTVTISTDFNPANN